MVTIRPLKNNYRNTDTEPGHVKIQKTYQLVQQGPWAQLH